jgi:drug/metabolite transporter (DMT)-like permease
MVSVCDHCAHGVAAAVTLSNRCCNKFACRIGQQEPALVVALWFHSVTIALMVWPLLLGLPEHAKLVAPRDCLLLLGIATTSFFAQLLMTRSFQLIPAARAAAVSFTGASNWRCGFGNS